MWMGGAKALTRLHMSTGSLQPSLLAYTMSIKILCAGSNIHVCMYSAEYGF